MATSAADHSRWQGYGDINAAMLYTHVLNRGPAGVRSPLDGM